MIFKVNGFRKLEYLAFDDGYFLSGFCNPKFNKSILNRFFGQKYPFCPVPFFRLPLL